MNDSRVRRLLDDVYSGTRSGTRSGKIDELAELIVVYPTSAHCCFGNASLLVNAHTHAREGYSGHYVVLPSCHSVVPKFVVQHGISKRDPLLRILPEVNQKLNPLKKFRL